MPEPGPTGLEIATSSVVGPARERLAVRALPVSPLRALLDAVRPALLNPPCLVTFSGGVDSSLVLAAATRVARLEGLALPVPVTWRPTGAPAASESGWQELVVRELGLSDWERWPTGDALDLVGDVARRALRRHGLLLPFNGHLHLPVFEAAGGGSVLTGIGGDQVLAGRAPVGVASAWRGRLPRRALGRLRAARRPHRHPWLVPVTARRMHRAEWAQWSGQPAAYDRYVAWQLNRRLLRLSIEGKAALAAASGTTVVHPLLDPTFLGALQHRYGAARDVQRARVVAALGCPGLPAAVARRPTKALFGEVFWRAPSRKLTRAWSGEGVDRRLVDPDALRRAWAGERPVLATAGLVQQLWLAADRGRTAQ